ncbi:MAG: anaerobic ribonucleoside-triphosphate reductase activating protein [Bacilli bacterium]|jgi:pyruvate formate lyase activating enzyme
MDFVGIEKLSLVDYEGKLTCTLFMAGCNFRCPFCHNASLVLQDYSINPIPFEEILSYLKNAKGKLEAVCISGGEPTLMRDLKEKIRPIKDLGYLIKIDTNGTNPELLKELYQEKLLDYVALDVKNCEEAYPETIGHNYQPFANIQKSIAFLMNSGIEYEFRTTLVQEFHSRKKIDALGKMIKGAKKLYLQKFVDTGSTIKKGLNPIPLEEAKEYQKILEKYIQKVELRGY